MVSEFRAPDADAYVIMGRQPFREVEPIEREVRVVGDALAALVDAGVLTSASYDEERFAIHRAAVRETFEVMATAITPRMERLIWAINAIHRPQVMIAAGVYVGFTFICNAGAAVGPGKVYDAKDLVGLEPDPKPAEIAERNVRAFDPGRKACILETDARPFVGQYPDPIDLLYLDADVMGHNKGVNLEILQAAYHRIPEGGLVLTHDSVFFGQQLAEHLAWVRDESNFRASTNIVIDRLGLEVSIR